MDLSNITPDQANKLGQNILPGLIGFDFTSFDDGRVEAELEVRQALMAPNGFLHAGAIISLADSACGFGAIMNLPEGSSAFTTIELKSNFLGTAREGFIRVVAEPLHLGRTTQLWDAKVTRKEDSKMIALFRCTQMVLWPHGK